MTWLKTIRVQGGNSQDIVARAVGLSQPTYANIENEKRKPSVRSAKKIAELFGFEWTKFFENE